MLQCCTMQNQAFPIQVTEQGLSPFRPMKTDKKWWDKIDASLAPSLRTANA
jgi:hypothetical protein